MTFLKKLWCKLSGHSLKSEYSYSTQHMYTLLGGNKYREHKFVTSRFTISCTTCGEVLESSDENVGSTDGETRSAVA